MGLNFTDASIWVELYLSVNSTSHFSRAHHFNSRLVNENVAEIDVKNATCMQILPRKMSLESVLSKRLRVKSSSAFERKRWNPMHQMTGKSFDTIWLFRIANEETNPPCKMKSSHERFLDPNVRLCTGPNARLELVSKARRKFFLSCGRRV